MGETLEESLCKFSVAFIGIRKTRPGHQERILIAKISLKLSRKSARRKLTKRKKLRRGNLVPQRTALVKRRKVTMIVSQGVLTEISIQKELLVQPIPLGNLCS